MDNITLTQRIVGAIVILSLAIIFIPLLLETDRINPGNINRSPIPEVPSEISTIIFQLNEETGKFEGKGETVHEKFADEVEKKIAASANEVAIESELSKEKIVRKPNTVTDSVQTAVSDTPEIEKRYSWMLQLASFKDKDNAIELRDKLRKMSYVANVDEISQAQGSLWRVRIGPDISREKMEIAQQRIFKELQLKGLIIRRR